MILTRQRAHTGASAYPVVRLHWRWQNHYEMKLTNEHRSVIVRAAWDELKIKRRHNISATFSDCLKHAYRVYKLYLKHNITLR